MDSPLVMTALAEGEEAIGNFLVRAAALNDLANSLPPKTLAEVQGEFAKNLLAEGGHPGVNMPLVAMIASVREHVAVAVQEFRKAEMWVAMKAPAVSDGNNFGVDVQNFVVAEMRAMRHAMQGMMDALSTYHWQRGLGLEKFVSGVTNESSKNETTEVDAEAKKSTKSSSSTSSKTTDSPKIADFVEYTSALDAKQYYTASSQLGDIKNCYIKAHMLFEKNAKRLADPRGEGESGGGNVMSMF